jgi:hypothetical protein
MLTMPDKMWGSRYGELEVVIHFPLILGCTFLDWLKAICNVFNSFHPTLSVRDIYYFEEAAWTLLYKTKESEEEDES